MKEVKTLGDRTGQCSGAFDEMERGSGRGAGCCTASMML